MWRAVDIDLFMKRWILLMKSGYVKAQKKNYLVFLIFIRIRLSAGTFRRNLAGSSGLIQAHFTKHPADISGAYRDTCFPIRTDRVVQLLDLYRIGLPLQGPEDWGGVQ